MKKRQSIPACPAVLPHPTSAALRPTKGTLGFASKQIGKAATVRKITETYYVDNKVIIKLRMHVLWSKDQSF
jgi:hypothetical protein